MISTVALSAVIVEYILVVTSHHFSSTKAASPYYVSMSITALLLIVDIVCIISESSITYDVLSVCIYLVLLDVVLYITCRLIDEYNISKVEDKNKWMKD